MAARRSVFLFRLVRSYWFLPALIVLLAAAAGFGLVELDRALLGRRVRIPWLYTGGPEGAADLLSAVAGSMITVAGVVFSITIVTLSLATSQYGPQTMSDFSRDRSNQAVLGFFVATFACSLLVLRTIRRGDGAEFVPHFAVGFCLLLSFANIGLLIYFLHNVATWIRPDALVRRSWESLRGTITTLFPERLGEGGEVGGDGADGGWPAEAARSAPAVPSPRNGYVEGIDGEALLETARTHDLVVRIVRGPGDFAPAGSPLLRVWPPGRLDGRAVGALQAAFTIGVERTPLQDPQLGVRTLGQLALRALSPSQADPYTARICLDWLGAALILLAGRALPSPFRRDAGGRLRVVAPPYTFDRMCEDVFDPLRGRVAEDPGLALHCLEVIERIGPHARRPGDRGALRRHALRIAEESSSRLPSEEDRRRIRERSAELLDRLSSGG